jgi:antitoxin (DNA-binding transcriptional repressor) of toxin-antitoxin stability system
MKTIEISQATGPLGQYARQLDDTPLVLTDQGRPVAALMAIDEADLESWTLSTNPKFLALIEQARAQHRTGAGLTTDEVRRELGLR